MNYLKVGNITFNNGEIKIEREYYEQGFIYKDSQAFINKTNDICYVPELSDTTYTYNDFIKIVRETLENNVAYKHFLNQSKITEQDLAEDLFETVDWQHPTTLLEEYTQNF